AGLAFGFCAEAGAGLWESDWDCGACALGSTGASAADRDDVDGPEAKYKLTRTTQAAVAAMYHSRSLAKSAARIHGLRPRPIRGRPKTRLLQLQQGSAGLWD